MANTISDTRDIKFQLTDQLRTNFEPDPGAMSFGLRRSNRNVAEGLTASGTIFGTDEMLQNKPIDMVVDDGERPSAVHDYLRDKARCMRTLFKTRWRVWHLTCANLDAVAAIGVNAASRIKAPDLRLMGPINTRQDQPV